MGRKGTGGQGDGVRSYKTSSGSIMPLVIFNYQLPITNPQLPITNYQLPITNYQLPITNYKLPITNSLSPIPYSKFGKNIKQREEYNPDDIYKVPVDFCHLDSGMFVFGIMSGATGTP